MLGGMHLKYGINSLPYMKACNAICPVRSMCTNTNLPVFAFLRIFLFAFLRIFLFAFLRIFFI